MAKTKLKKVIDNVYKDTISIKDKDVLQELSDLSEAKKKAFIDFLLDLGIPLAEISISAFLLELL